MQLDKQDTAVEDDDLKQHLENTSIEAQIATSDEHTLTVQDALRKYPKAVFWSVAMSMTIIMEGYDSALMGNFFAYPSFAQKYGSYDQDHGYVVETRWQTGLSVASLLGASISLLASGWLTEKFGHRQVINMSLLVLIGIIFMQFFAPTIEVLQAAQVLVGLPWGIFAVMGPTYASEVCPVALRGYLTSFVNLCWVIGQLISAGVLQGLVNNPTQWSYRIPFAIQWAWPVPLIVLTFFAPDSPWWLVRHGKLHEAEQSIKRLGSNLTPAEIRNSISLMVHTDTLEKAMMGKSSFLDCFKGTNLRRSEIAAMSLCAQSFCGQVFAYTPSYFLVQAGFNSNDAYKISFGSAGFSFICTCLSWVFMFYAGRRTLFLSGLSAMTLTLLIIGVLACFNSQAAQWAQGGLAIAWLGLYSATLGPQSFAIASEISATRVRAHTIALATNAYNLISVVSNVVEPQLINPTAADLKGKTAFIWMATSALTLIWAIFRLPESKGRTYEELDLLFERRLPAWKFAHADLTAMGEENEMQDWNNVAPAETQRC